MSMRLHMPSRKKHSSADIYATLQYPPQHQEDHYQADRWRSPISSQSPSRFVARDEFTSRSAASTSESLPFSPTQPQASHRTPLMATPPPAAQDFVSHTQHQQPLTPRDIPQTQQQMPLNFAMGDDDSAAAPPDILSRRGNGGVYSSAPEIPARASSREPGKKDNKFKKIFSRSREPSVVSTQEDVTMPTTPDSLHERSSGERSSGADSVISYETKASSVQTLQPLQTKGPLNDVDRMEPLIEDDPRSFDLIAPLDYETPEYSLEKRYDLLLSREHLANIFQDAQLLQKFTTFLSVFRPKSIPVLIYYLDATKAIRAINYSNAVAEALEPVDGLGFTEVPARATINSVLEDKARQAFDLMVRDDLPAYITHTWIKSVSATIEMRISRKLPPHLMAASEGLAETFCLTDPSRRDNPIIFASDEFHRTTQYGVGYAIGRNCRFLQGPKTDKNAVRRLATALKDGRDITDILLNYRRDGSPFLNLLMMAPLVDSQGKVRYFIGSQVDISALARDSRDLPGLKRLVAQLEESDSDGDEHAKEQHRDEFAGLCELLNTEELEVCRQRGGALHRQPVDEANETGVPYRRPRLVLDDSSPEIAKEADFDFGVRSNGKLGGIYQHYLLVRPHPILRILFASPSMRVPGMLQSSFLDRITAKESLMDDLCSALRNGQTTTAKVRWISGTRSDDEGRSRRIHCTPLLAQDGSVGIWMIVLLDADGQDGENGGRRFRLAPPVSSTIGRRDMGRDRDRDQVSPARRHIVDTMAARSPRDTGHYNRSSGANGSPRLDARSVRGSDRLPFRGADTESVDSYRI